VRVGAEIRDGKHPEASRRGGRRQGLLTVSGGLIYGDFNAPSAELDFPELGITIEPEKVTTSFIKSAMCVLETAVPPEEAADAALLSALRTLSPNGFERVCQRLLRESGFENVTVTGRSHDGGIDGTGILQVNALVSLKVLFQCKRYKGSVSREQVGDFRGAIIGRADKGIILTTGTFSSARCWRCPVWAIPA
jgi:HJR/Mrr/RecB family endonuclease